MSDKLRNMLINQLLMRHFSKTCSHILTDTHITTYTYKKKRKKRKKKKEKKRKENRKKSSIKKIKNQLKNTNIFQHKPTHTKCQHIPTQPHTNIYQHIPTHINTYQHIRTPAFAHQHIPTHINTYQHYTNTTCQHI